jgi:cytochrome c biogenesis factor
VYVVLVQTDTDDRATFHVFVNPLVFSLLAGGWLFLLGTLIAAWPDARPLAAGVPTAPPREAVASGA